MLPSDIRSIHQAYSSIYEEIDLVTDELVEEVVEELIQECLEFGYNLDESAAAVEEAAELYFDTEYLEEAKITYGSDTESPEERRARAKAKVGEKKVAARKAAVKGAVEKAKSKATGAKAAAGIAASIAKDEARRAGRAAAHAVTHTVQKKKAEVKSGVKSLLGKGLRKAAGAVGKVAQKAAGAASRLGEDFELWVESLVKEGYDISDYSTEELFDIYEAEGSYGQTPKARQAMGKLAIARREKPASEYSQKGEKTKKVKAIEKHTRRIDNGPDVGNRGKKSTKPRHSGFLGKSGRGKLDQDSRDYARDSAVEYTAGGHKPGPGTVTKNPKKLRKQKAMGEFAKEDVQVDNWDVVLEYLITNGHADTNSEALYIMSQMNEEMIQSILDEDAKYDRNRKRAAQRAQARNEARARGQTGVVPGVGYVSPRPERATYRDSAGVERHHSGAKMPDKK